MLALSAAFLLKMVQKPFPCGTIFEQLVVHALSAVERKVIIAVENLKHRDRKEFA